VIEALLLVATGAATKLGRTATRVFVAIEAAAAVVALGLAAFSLSVEAGWVSARFEAAHRIEPGPVAPAPAAKAAAGEVEAKTDLAILLRDLGSEDEDRREAALEAIAARRDPAAVPSLAAALDGATGSWRVHIARALARLGSARGVEVLVEFLATGAPPFDRGEALDTLREIAGQDFGYDAEKAAPENAAAIARWREWWDRHRGRLHWDRASGKLEAEPH
jgi:HEAT repeat protein